MNEKQFDQKQKVDIVNTAKEVGFKEAAKIAGVHYTTVYDWQRRIEALGVDAFLSYQVNWPGRGVKQVSGRQEKLVLDVFLANPGFGPGQVRNQLRRKGESVSIRTVRLIMEANGYEGRRKKDKKEAPHRFEASRPLELAQMDILEFFINKLKVFIILLMDDFSRFILGWRLLEHTLIDDVIDVVAKAVLRYGKMEELLTDRGFVFYSWRGINRFEQYLEFERIDHTHARPHHPQTLGKVEALNKRIKTELIDKEHFSTAHEAESAIGKWVDHYNNHRTHQGFGGLLVPSERFHGKADQVLKEIAKGLDVTGQQADIDRSIVNLVLSSDGKITLYLLGEKFLIKGGFVSEKITPEEVAIMIRARKIAKEKGLRPDADVSAICKAAGISRKTGYEWLEKYSGFKVEEGNGLAKEIEKLKSEHEKLKQDFDWVSFENRGRKLAWEIHRVDE